MKFKVDELKSPYLDYWFCLSIDIYPKGNMIVLGPEDEEELTEYTLMHIGHGMVTKPIIIDWNTIMPIFMEKGLLRNMMTDILERMEKSEKFNIKNYNINWFKYCIIKNKFGEEVDD